MSNVIKSKFVYLDDEDQKKITPLSNFITDQKDNINQISNNTKSIDGSRFKQEFESYKEEQLSVIKKEAEIIIKNAEAKADEIAKTAYDKGEKQGYNDGHKRALALENELSKKIKQQEEDYRQLIKKLEPSMAKLIIDLIYKITGILVSNNEVIEHLVHEAITNSKKSSIYIIKVSEEDYDIINRQKDKIKSLVDEETKIEIDINKNLEKDQAMIETDAGIINCSLDVQLDNLYRNIELLANT